MFTMPRIIVTILFILCFVLNAISIGLCLSALFLLILAYLDLGYLLGETQNNEILPAFESSPIATTSVFSILNNVTASSAIAADFIESENSTTIQSTTTTSVPFFNSNSEPLLPESNPDQLNLIFYLLFYLAVAILGIMGASRRYRKTKINYLTCHVLLLGSIICFNLLAWFHFRTYSPLSKTSEEDPNLLLASLFDFVDFLVGFTLLISLLLNKKQNIRTIKQRNSITPIMESPNGSNKSYTIA